MAEKLKSNLRGGQTARSVNIWALAFGCTVGWGCFVMPGTTFLPLAGPTGTAIAMTVGAAVMLVIAANYHYMIRHFPDNGGSYTFAKNLFGYDHGFLCGWFLWIAYAALIWANATAFALIARNVFENFLSFGFHYQVAGYDVYFGEALFTIFILIIFGFFSIRAKNLLKVMNTVFAFTLFLGVCACFLMAFVKSDGPARFLPAFSGTPASGVIKIVSLAPWAFMGFEAVSHTSGEAGFPKKRAFVLMALAVAAAALSYSLMAFTAVLNAPDGFSGWPDYIGDLNAQSGLAALPTFFVMRSLIGKSGLALLCVTILSALSTSLIGYYQLTARLTLAITDDGILPEWFSRRNRYGNPRNALMFIMLISLVVPFLGRTAIGWLTDVTTVGAAVAYGYTSAAAWKTAKDNHSVLLQITGVLGVLFSVLFAVFLIVQNLRSVSALATESYLILAAWTALGFVFFWFVFLRDRQDRYGKSVVVWFAMICLIFFLSIMWTRQATHVTMEEAVDSVSGYYAGEMESLSSTDAERDAAQASDEYQYLERTMNAVRSELLRNSIIQMALILISLWIMLNLYIYITRREKRMKLEKIQAEAAGQAKTSFLFNMSHDIRTPMNAIIGYTNLARRKDTTPEEAREYLAKIESSSKHLLALINDVLEMSRIESGKMTLEPVEIDLKSTMCEIKDMFSTQMREKEIDFTVNFSQIQNSAVLCDQNLLNRVFLNLLSNAYKFTPAGGTVSVTLWQIETANEGYAKYELRVRDSGIGMTKEFAAKVFEAFERERTSTVSGIQGTGLGMAITKSIIDLMGGTIEVVTAPGEGTEFIVRVPFELARDEKIKAIPDSQNTDQNPDAPETNQENPGNQENPENTSGGADKNPENQETPDFSGTRILLTEDNEINREIALLVLEDIGFQVEEAVNGAEAVEKISHSTPGDYDLILMDIQMPVMDGYEAARRIRALSNPELAKIPIVAMTANAFKEDIQAALDAGMNAHIAKPLDITKMTGTLRAVLCK